MFGRSARAFVPCKTPLKLYHLNPHFLVAPQFIAPPQFPSITAINQHKHVITVPHRTGVIKSLLGRTRSQLQKIKDRRKKVKDFINWRNQVRGKNMENEYVSPDENYLMDTNRMFGQQGLHSKSLTPESRLPMNYQDDFPRY